MPIHTDTEGKRLFYIDRYLQQNLDKIKQAIKKDWDCILIIDGRFPGSGKSTLAQQLALYFDPTFNIDRICFDPDEFARKVVDARKYQAILYDEALGGFYSRRAMSGVNVGLISLLSEIRQKNLFIIIVIPSFFDLDKGVCLNLAKCLLHVFSRGFKRGFYKFFGPQKIKELYIKGKKNYNYNEVRPDFISRFTKGYTVDDKEYRTLKYKALQRHIQRENKGKMPAKGPPRSVLFKQWLGEFSKRLEEPALHAKIPMLRGKANRAILTRLAREVYLWQSREGIKLLQDSANAVDGEVGNDGVREKSVDEPETVNSYMKNNSVRGNGEISANTDSDDLEIEPEDEEDYDE